MLFCCFFRKNQNETTRKNRHRKQNLTKIYLITCRALTTPSIISGSIRGSSPCMFTTMSNFFWSFWSASLQRSVPSEKITEQARKIIQFLVEGYQYGNDVRSRLLPFWQESDVINTSAPNDEQHSAIF